MSFDIIPDIHGQSEKLHRLLAQLGWRRAAAGWANDDPNRQIVFLGDFIDRGPDNAGVLDTVRSLIDAGKAQAVMGNHELNAIHYHTPDPKNKRKHLRRRTKKNKGQHASFLNEFPRNSAQAADAIAWMRTLPLYLEMPGFRAVHACWNDDHINRLRAETADGVLNEEQFSRAANESDPLYSCVETTTKGPEVALPTGCEFVDKDGTKRKEVRVQWWKNGAASWIDLAMSVPNPEELPITAPPRNVTATTYPRDSKPVFFGHYWLSGEPVLQARNALCLDYSAGKDGPLVAYRVQGDEEPTCPIELGNLVIC